MSAKIETTLPYLTSRYLPFALFPELVKNIALGNRTVSRSSDCDPFLLSATLLAHPEIANLL